MSNVIRLEDRRKAEPVRTDEERIAKVRQSLDKINRLMAELKQLSGETANSKVVGAGDDVSHFPEP